ncbi:histone deacetylase [Coemansia sp. IMI 209127]|nr:histone deacetylase [Coemansia sp. IMI 209127]
MKPHRIRMTHNLVMSYELYKKMSIYRAAPATCQEMTQFHSDDYVDFLHRVTPENASQFQRELGKYNFEDDCPVFDGMFDLFSLSAGSSMEGAARLNRGLSDICINWSGGLHHAKKCEASGFCYINDIVLAILELLRHHQRVLYIDIDVHHGDGVEEAFYTTDRVMTCSFHKYGEFFPGTGDLRDVGEAKGKYYSVNFPLRDGIDDLSYESIFKPVVQHIMEWYQPNAVVLQCGTDSLAGDKIGAFNLSMDGHAECVRFVKGFNLPTLVLGGGGYTIRNVSRVWAYETGILVGCEMDRRLPMNDYMDYYAPEYTLDVPAYNAENSNSPEYLERIRTQVLQNLDRTRFAPSVQMHDVPRDADHDLADEDALDPDERMPETTRDQHVVPDAEMYEADSMGLKETAKDGTKVVNEEINDMGGKPKLDEDIVMNDDGDGNKATDDISADGSNSPDAVAPNPNSGDEAMDVDNEKVAEISPEDNNRSVDSAVPAAEAPIHEKTEKAASPELIAGHADGEQANNNNGTTLSSAAKHSLGDGSVAETKEESNESTICEKAAEVANNSVTFDSATKADGSEEHVASTESPSASKKSGSGDPAIADDVAAESVADTFVTAAKDNSTNSSHESKSLEQPVSSQATKHESTTVIADQSTQENENPGPSEVDNIPVVDNVEISASKKELPLHLGITGGALVPLVKSIREMQTNEKEEGEATEDDYEDEDGEIKDMT